MMLLSLSIVAACNPVVSEATIRLPSALPGQRPTMLLSAKGSVQWSALDDGIVSLDPLDPMDNNSSVRVSVLCQTSAATKIIASSPDGQSTSINVFIAPIAQARIISRNRVLYLNSSSEIYSIIAFDRDGNAFNSLDGLGVHFIYNESKIRRVQSSNRFASHLSASDILIQGQEAGKAGLQASIDSGIETDIIELTVVEPFFLFPSHHLIILPSTEYRFSLCSERGIEHGQHREICSSEISLPSEQFRFNSLNTSVFTVNSSGVITSVSKGRSQLVVEDSLNPLNREFATIQVSTPDHGSIEEQWILVGSQPSVKALLFDSTNSQIYVPSATKWNVSGTFSKPGTTDISAAAFGIVLNGTVHVCEPPSFYNKTIRVSPFSDAFVPSIRGGSLNFSLNSSNETVAIITNSSLKPLNPGVSVITLFDNLFPSFNSSLTIEVEEIASIVVNATQREIYIGSKLQYHVYALSSSNKLFDFLPKFGIEVSNKSVMNEDLIAKAIGFTNVTFSLAEKAQAIIISVIEPLTISSSICGTSKKWLNLNRKGGPLNFSYLNERFECGVPSKFRYDSVMFNDEFSGICKLYVKNNPSIQNPNPIEAVAEVKVTITAISKLSIVITDLNASGKCQMSNSIHENHSAKVEVIAYDKQNSSIGRFFDPEMEVTDGLNSIQFSDGVAFINFTESSTLYLSEPGLPSSSTRIEVIHPFSLAEPPIIYSNRTFETGILNGSGIFEVECEGCKVEGRRLKVMPLEKNRTLTIRDACFPENFEVQKIEFVTPIALRLKAPSFGILGKPIKVYATLISSDKSEINEQFYLFENFSSPGLNRTAAREFSFIPKTMGIFSSKISTSNLSSEFSIQIYEPFSFFTSSIEILEGESSDLPLSLGSFNMSNLSFNSTNASIAFVKNGDRILGISSGNATITATSKIDSFPTASLAIRVLRIRELRVNSSSLSLSPGSEVVLTPLLITDAGERKAKNVAWSINGTKTWTKLSGSAVVVKCEREGYIRASAKSNSGAIGNISIYVDYPLSVPKYLKLPIGSTYQIAPTEPISVTYSGASENGTFYCSSIGSFVVISKYKSQISSTLIEVSTPKNFYLSSEEPEVLRPILLDEDGKLYSSLMGINFKFNISSKPKGESFIFSVLPDAEEPIRYVGATASNAFFNLSSSAIVFSSSLLHPRKLNAQRGSTVDYICFAKKQNWISENQTVATISEVGTATAEMVGTTKIRCSESIDAELHVVEYEGVELNKVSNDSYLIRPILSETVENVSFVDDLVYKCEWSAELCGVAELIMKDGSYMCKLALKEKRVCPLKSTLTVTAESHKAGISVSDTSIVVMRNQIDWGFEPLMNITLSDKNSFVTIPTSIKRDDVIIETSSGLDVNISEKGELRINASISSIGEEGRIVLDHKKSSERAMIFVKRGSYASVPKSMVTKLRRLDSLLLWSFVALSFALGVGVTYYARTSIQKK